MDTTIKKSILHAHDQFIRTVMTNPRVARDFFTAYLPNEIREITNLNHLILQPRSHIDDIRKEMMGVTSF